VRGFLPLDVRGPTLYNNMGATLNEVQMALYNLGVVASGCAVARAHSPIIVGALIIYVCICVCADRSK
jgi:hypothetical protein